MIKPMGERVLVKSISFEKKTKSGIILSDSTTNEDLVKAKVIQISDEIKNLKIEDIVYFSKFKGENIKYDEIEYILIDLKDILAKEVDNG